jgi:hypothetical protein
MPVSIQCLVKGHDWTEWQHWSLSRPRIVRASLECLNDRTQERKCQRCGLVQFAPPHTEQERK